MASLTRENQRIAEYFKCDGGDISPAVGVDPFSKTHMRLIAEKEPDEN